MLIIEMTSKREPVCIGCRFAIETEDGRVFCGNRNCVWFLRSTACRCEQRELKPIIDSFDGMGKGK